MFPGLVAFVFTFQSSKIKSHSITSSHRRLQFKIPTSFMKKFDSFLWKVRIFKIIKSKGCMSAMYCTTGIRWRNKSLVTELTSWLFSPTHMNNISIHPSRCIYKDVQKEELFITPQLKKNINYPLTPYKICIYSTPQKNVILPKLTNQCELYPLALVKFLEKI